MNTCPRFEVESLMESAGGMALVLARRLDDCDFAIRKGSLLNGVPIDGPDIPRYINDVGGKLQGDLWGFWLENSGNLAKPSVGQVVELTKPADPQ